MIPRGRKKLKQEKRNSRKSIDIGLYHIPRNVILMIPSGRKKIETRKFKTKKRSVRGLHHSQVRKLFTWTKNKKSQRNFNMMNKNNHVTII